MLQEQPASPNPAQETLAAELAAVLAAVEAGILVIDGDGRVRSQNQAAERIFEGGVDGLLDLVGPLGRTLGPGGPGLETTELQVLRLPDRWLQVSRFRVAPEPSVEQDVGEVLVVRDVTQARQSQGLREAFLGMLSHELRTPVTSIYAASDLLGARLTTLSQSERLDLIADIYEESERLLRLVDDLLVLAHFDEGIDLVQEPSLVQRVIPIVVERERRRFPGVAIELHIGVGLPVVTGDETSVQQVTRNLISNAIKYGRGQPVRLQIESSQDEPGAIVRVLDRGPGVTPAEAEALFRPFFRSARTARLSTGAGIGLYVCRRLVEAMGGHMWARQRDGGGSEFGYWLPAYADADAETGEAETVRPAPLAAVASQEVPHV